MSSIKAFVKNSRRGYQGSWTSSIKTFVKIGNRDVVKTRKKMVIKGCGFKGFIVKSIVFMVVSKITTDDGSGGAATDENDPKT